MRFDDLEILDLNSYENEDSKEIKIEVFEGHKTSSRRNGQDEDEVNWKKELVSWILTIGITVVVMFGIKEYVIINANVPTGSMENAIMPGDNVFGFRLAYLNDEPKRGDVIFFYFPDDETQKYVKRIIGLPGEKVTILDGKVYINDSEVPLKESYLKEKWTVKTGPYEFLVPEGCYFCMGDNRNASADAREWNNPYVAKEKIIGKALWIYFPFDHWGEVK